MRVFDQLRVLILAAGLSLGLGSGVARADEFLSALEVAIQEAQVQKVYYSDLIQYLDQDHLSLWSEGYCGVYPGLPSAPFSNPALAFQMAQQSVIFWDSAEFQLEQLKRFYEGLPEGAFKTRPLQKLLLEIVYEFSQSATIAFFDLHANINLLKKVYHSHRKSAGLRRDTQVTQALLDSVTAHFFRIYAEIKERKGVHPHWNVAQVPGLKQILSFLPSSLLSDQYYSDFNQSINFTEFLLQFYQGSLTDLKEVEEKDKETQRWVRVISAYFNASPKSFAVILYCEQQFVPKDQILLSKEERLDLDQMLKKSILRKSMMVAFSKRDEILSELARLRELEASRAGADLPSASSDPQVLTQADGAHCLESVHQVTEPSVFLQKGQSKIREDAEMERASVAVEQLSSLNLSSLPVQRECAHRSEVFASAAPRPDAALDLHPAQSEAASFAAGRREVSAGTRENQGQFSSEKGTKVSESAAGEDFGLVQEEGDDYDYLRDLKAEHEHYQSLKKGRRSPPDQKHAGLEGARALDGPGSLEDQQGACLAPACGGMIHLSGNALDTYLTALGKRASRQIRNREVHELVSALGGRLDFTLGDVRIVLPNRSDDATGSELYFKMHFRHSGRETFPLGTLKAFLGSAIERAGLVRWVRY